MPRFDVTLHFTTCATYTVEAQTEDQAHLAAINCDMDTDQIINNLEDGKDADLIPRLEFTQEYFDYVRDLNPIYVIGNPDSKQSLAKLPDPAYTRSPYTPMIITAQSLDGNGQHRIEVCMTSTDQIKLESDCIRLHGQRVLTVTKRENHDILHYVWNHLIQSYLFHTRQFDVRDYVFHSRLTQFRDNSL